MLRCVVLCCCHAPFLSCRHCSFYFTLSSNVYTPFTICTVYADTHRASADNRNAPVVGGAKSNAVYNVVRPFEKIRQADQQNEMYAKSAFVLHERTSK